MRNAWSLFRLGGLGSALAFLFTLVSAWADGFIIVHDPMPLPRPIPPPDWRIPQPRHYAFAPLEVTFHQVEVRVKDQVAVTAVDQEFYNPNDRQLEGTYIFPIPKGGQIDKFSMEVGGKQVEAELLAADKARQIYEDIVRRMKDPALLEYAGRDIFKMRIFPIEPRSKKRVKISYTQLLKADTGLVRYIYPLNTEKFSAKPIRTVSLKLELETKRPLKSVYSPSHKVEIRRHGENRATIGFEAKDVRPDTDFELFFAPETDAIGVNLLAYRTRGEEGYFLLLASPGFETKGEKVIPKDVTFVLDSSGSMAGSKLEQAKKALLFCVESLNDADRFEVIHFATEIEPLFNQLTSADKEHRRKATEFIRDLKSSGGTAIEEALRKALAIKPEKSDRPYVVIFLTDGQPTVGITDPDRILSSVKQASGNTRVFCFGIGHDVNTHLLDNITEATRSYSQYVLPEEDIEVKVSSFFGKIKEPVLANLKLSFPESVRTTKLYPTAMPDLFQGEQLVLAGRYSGAGGGKATLEGTVGSGSRRFVYDLRFPEEARDHEFIPRLWATRRVGYLLDEIRLHGENAELRDEVTDLARKYSIVTPYTAYLIHEDETRRQVPLAMQSMPALRENRDLYEASQGAYSSLKRDVSGGAAVAAARYGMAQKSAEQVGDALRLARTEAGRAMVAATPPPVASPVPTAPGAAGARPNRPAAVAMTAAKPAEVARQVDNLSQQTQFVAGRSFFQNGKQWIDTQVQQQTGAKRVRIQFGSTEYFALLTKEPQTKEWLALGQNVQFVLKGQVYEIYE